MGVAIWWLFDEWVIGSCWKDRWRHEKSVSLLGSHFPHLCKMGDQSWGGKQPTSVSRSPFPLPWQKLLVEYHIFPPNTASTSFSSQCSKQSLQPPWWWNYLPALDMLYSPKYKDKCRACPPFSQRWPALAFSHGISLSPSCRLLSLIRTLVITLGPTQTIRRLSPSQDL